MSSDTSAATSIFDQQKAEGFAESMLDTLNRGAIALMTSVGYRVGLLDAMSDLPASASHEIAFAAGLNERYVRERLGAMVTGRVVEYDAGTNGTCSRLKMLHFLPGHRRRITLPHLLSIFLFSVRSRTQLFNVLKKGGGVPYSAYPRFHEVMAEDSAQTVVAALSSAILPLVPGLVERMHEGIDVLDAGCGSGRALCAMARDFPASSFVGYDISERGISAARERAGDLRNVNFEVKEVTHLPEADRYDLMTAFDAIHDQIKPLAVLKETAKSLKPDGVFLMQDIRSSSELENNLDHPVGPFLYTISCLHCMKVSLARKGDGLGAMWGEEKARAYLEEAGFSRVVTETMPHDFQNNFYIVSKG